MKFRTVFDLSIKNLEHFYYKITSQRHRIVPYKIVVELTTQCNSKCLYCDIWKIKKEDLQKINLEDFENFLKKMNHHLVWLALTGGEISSYNQFPEVVKLIKKYCPKLRILTFTTNGILPQRILNYALLMKTEINCDVFVTISLDGDEETHDTVRGIKGNYAKCMETYNLLEQNHIACHFGITVGEKNLDFIQNLYKKYRDSIKAVTVFHTGGIFLTDKSDEKNSMHNLKMAEAMETIYDQYKISSLGEILVKIYLKIGILFLKKDRQTNIIPCDVGLSSAHLMANGNLQPCMFLPPVKKIGEGFSLDDFHNPETLAMLEMIKQDKCPHCWMSCYGPHSILQSPVKSLAAFLKPI